MTFGPNFKFVGRWPSRHSRIQISRGFSLGLRRRMLASAPFFFFGSKTHSRVFPDNVWRMNVGTSEIRNLAMPPWKQVRVQVSVLGTMTLQGQSVRAPQARRLEPAPEAHWEPPGTPDHSDRTRFIKRASRTRTGFNRSISIL